MREFINLCKEYKRSDQRVEHFWKNFLNLQDKEQYYNLYIFLKKVLIVSHGQAFVGRCFSINKQVIMESQLHRSIVAQRQIFDDINSADSNGINNVKINKNMISSFQCATRRYMDALKKQRLEKQEEELKTGNKRLMLNQIVVLKAKEAKLMTEKTN